MQARYGKRDSGWARLAATWAAAAALLLPGSASSLPVTLTGSLTNAGTSYDIATLQSAFTPTAVTVGGNAYVGVPLWVLLGGTMGADSSTNGNVIPNGGGGNPILRTYVTAMGSDGSRSLLSIGEVNRWFGGNDPNFPANANAINATPTLVAYQVNGSLLTTPQLILPGDATGTRNVVDLVSLDVQALPQQGGGGGLTTEFMVSGGSNPDATYDRAALEALGISIVAEDVVFISGPSPTQPNDFTGVELWDLLLLAGISHFDVLTSYVVAMGSDGYQTLFSFGELHPDYGDRLALVAYDDTNGTLASSSGFARMVLDGDVRGGRYVSNLTSFLIVGRQQVPEPGSLALAFAAMFGLFALRRGSRTAR